MARACAKCLKPVPKLKFPADAAKAAKKAKLLTTIASPVAKTSVAKSPVPKPPVPKTPVPVATTKRAPPTITAAALALPSPAHVTPSKHNYSLNPLPYKKPPKAGALGKKGKGSSKEGKEGKGTKVRYSGNGGNSDSWW